jgi:hypothetical protein
VEGQRSWTMLGVANLGWADSTVVFIQHYTDLLYLHNSGKVLID